MKIHEYQAKELLAAAGAPIPRGIVAASPAEAAGRVRPARRRPVVLKAQVHAGGRGKGRFKDSGKDFGGVKFIKNRDDVAAVAEVMFKYPLVTKQTGAQGQKVGKVLVQEAADIAREIYVGMVLDRADRHAGADGLCRRRRRDRGSRGPQPGEDPQGRRSIPTPGLQPFQARRLAFELGFTGEQVGAGREDHDRPWPASFSTRIAASPRSTRWS